MSTRNTVMLASSTWWTKRLRAVRDEPAKMDAIVRRIIQSVREDEAGCCLRQLHSKEIAGAAVEALEERIAFLRRP